MIKMASEKACCEVCHIKDWGSDVHHLRYRKKWADTKQCDLVVLCRQHHKDAHDIHKEFPNMAPKEVLMCVKEKFKERNDFRKCCQRFVGFTDPKKQFYRRKAFFKIIHSLRKNLTPTPISANGLSLA